MHSQLWLLRGSWGAEPGFIKPIPALRVQTQIESHGSSRTRTPLLASTSPLSPPPNRTRLVTIDPHHAPSNPAHGEPRVSKPLHPPKQPPELSPADRIRHFPPSSPKTTQFQPFESNLRKSPKSADIKAFARPPTSETPSPGISSSLKLAIAPVPTQISSKISYLQAPHQGPHRRFSPFSYPVPVSECLMVHTPSHPQQASPVLSPNVPLCSAPLRNAEQTQFASATGGF